MNVRFLVGEIICVNVPYGVDFYGEITSIMRDSDGSVHYEVAPTLTDGTQIEGAPLMTVSQNRCRSSNLR